MGRGRLLLTAAALSCVASFSTVVHASPAYVVFLVDGAPTWSSLTAALPAADATLLMDMPSSGAHDSASIASEMSTGCGGGARRAVTPAGLPLGAHARAAGAALGAVSDACVLDPTSASFFASAPDRYSFASVAASIRAFQLNVSLGGPTRLLADRNGSCGGGPGCCPSTRAELAAVASSCAPGAPVMGLLGSLDAARAAECESATLDVTLLDLTSAALARLRAAVPRVGLFLIVAADRMDHLAHAGDAAGCAAAEVDVTASVRATLSVLEPRLRAGDAMVVVTGDHMTPLNGTDHSSESVPLLLYGAGARSAAAAALGAELSASLTVPHVSTTAFPRLFSFWGGGPVSCEPSTFNLDLQRPVEKGSDVKTLDVVLVVVPLAVLVVVVALAVARRSVPGKRE